MKCVILSYNHPDLTSKCVDSALVFFPAPDVILVHNASLSKNCEHLKLKYPELIHLILPQNGYYTGGTNAGLDLAFQNTDHVLYLTNDCELLEFSPQVLLQNQSLAAPLVMKRKTTFVDSIGGFLIPEKGLLGHFKSVQEWSRFQGLKYVPGSAFLIHRQIWQTKVRFREELLSYWEDVLFSQEVERLGFELRLCPEIKIRHGIGKSCHKDPFFTSYLYLRNRRWVSLMFVQGLTQRLSFGFYYYKDTLRFLFRALPAQRL